VIGALLARLFGRGDRGAADIIALRGEYRIQMHDAATGALVSEHTYRNVICANGKAYLAAWMNQEAGYGAMPTIYLPVGTSGTAPTSADTQLGAELARNPLAIGARGANVLTWSAFYSTSQAIGTWAEAGVFLGGSATANSGQLLSHCLISETKTSVVTATVQFTLTIG
jgi:hypothetical protein